jgi:hypothetical protein
MYSVSRPHHDIVAARPSSVSTREPLPRYRPSVFVQERVIAGVMSDSACYVSEATAGVDVCDATYAGAIRMQLQLDATE